MELKDTLRENSLTVVCLLCSFSGLALIYFAVLNIQPMQLRIEEITFELIGHSVATTGYISHRSIHPAGHIFLTLSNGKAKIKVPLFANYVKALNGNGFDARRLKKGTRIAVEGLVDEYKGELQIIPRKLESIKILSDGYGD